LRTQQRGPPANGESKLLKVGKIWAESPDENKQQISTLRSNGLMAVVAINRKFLLKI
jgi:hypothetical protein